MKLSIFCGIEYSIDGENSRHGASAARNEDYEVQRVRIEINVDHTTTIASIIEACNAGIEADRAALLARNKQRVRFSEKWQRIRQLQDAKQHGINCLTVLVGDESTPSLHRRFQMLIDRTGIATLYHDTPKRILVAQVDSNFHKIEERAIEVYLKSTATNLRVTYDLKVTTEEFLDTVKSAFGVEPAKFYINGREYVFQSDPTWSLFFGGLRLQFIGGLQFIAKDGGDAADAVPNVAESASCNIDGGVSSVIGGFGKLLESGEGSDFKLICSSDGERTFALHRLILIAQCPFFAAMLLPRADGTLSEEATSGRFDIDDMGADVVQCIVNYLYTGKCSLADDAKLPELFYGANKFQLDVLQADCEKKLADRLRVDNVVSIALLADRHRAKKLRTAALDFMKENAKELTRNDDFFKALSEHPTLLSDVVRAMVGN